ncbi:2881_t:CDS:2 [Diversispora eburnea]|uniref:2881_t:CDS:1 n=1 Tax=Diversispora eburnea TaxID=1213867 RepID=A0A9N8VJ40_9GLOM|nr:2881_t:CDS:2 [Diversispora eburnea]
MTDQEAYLQLLNTNQELHKEIGNEIAIDKANEKNSTNGLRQDDVLARLEQISNASQILQEIAQASNQRNVQTITRLNI